MDSLEEKFISRETALHFNIFFGTRAVEKIKHSVIMPMQYEPRCEKTGLRGFRPGPTQTGLYNNRRWLEA